MTTNPSVIVGLNAVIIAMTGEQPRVLTVSMAEDTPIEGGRHPSAGEAVGRIEGLPTGPLDPTGDRTLELALRRWVSTFTGVELGYVEQLYTFGDRFRDPRELEGGPRVVSVAYLALTRESEPDRRLAAHWRSVYWFFPWEDWRQGAPAVVNRVIGPALRDWIAAAEGPAERARRMERSAIAFGCEGSRWDDERVLERYELLYQLGLVSESPRDGTTLGVADRGQNSHGVVGQEMISDHRRILATAVGRIRAKIKYRPVVFELMPESFTLLELQRSVEALAGVQLHKQNFRRLVEQGGLVEGTGDVRRHTGGRPAAMFRFRRDVLLERPAPGVGLPTTRA